MTVVSTVPLSYFEGEKAKIDFDGRLEHAATRRPTYCDIFLKKNQSAPRPSEHPPVIGGEMSKRLGGIKGCKYKTSSWHLNRFPDADNTGSTV